MSWILTECDGISYYQCRKLNDSRLIQAFTTQKAGNMALHTGDDPKEVTARHNRFLRCLGLNPKQLVAAYQVHGIRISAVNGAQVGKSIATVQDLIPETDALITKERGVVLSIFTADCLPIFIYDPLTPAIGIVHAGWKGTLAGIAGLTVAKMKELFGTNPGQCRIGIGPSICGKCFQVSKDLADNFSKIFAGAVSQTESGFYIDLGLFNTWVLQQAGVSTEAIDHSNICTCCHPEQLFSYRATKTSGRSMGIIALNK